MRKIPKLNEENKALMQTVCARMIGNESFKEDFNVNKYFINYQETVDNLILFDENQQNILENFDKNPEKGNRAFYGPFGSGKTSVAIKCCNKLLERYKNIEVQVYLTTMTQWLSSKHEEGPPVTEPVIKMIQDNINTEKRENVSIQLGTLKQICAQMKIDVPKDDDEYIRDICSIINTLAEKMKNNHQNIPTILLPFIYV